jgi:folate-dependent phosphoribosylglycinamide formyltransferase PurN
LRIVFLAVDDEFAGLMQKYVYEQHPEWIVGCVISSCLLYRKSNLQAAMFLARHSGVRYIGEMVRMKIIRQLVNGRGTVSATTLARTHGVEVYRTGDINSAESLAKLRAWRPDLIISTNFSQYVGKEARGIAALGAWNLHKSYLPHYRGMAPNFYALMEGADSVGATLHVLEKGFDTGDILAQVKVPVAPGDGVYQLNQHTADAGGRMLMKVLQCPDLSSVRATPQPPGEWRTYSYPTRADVRAFRRRGGRF